MRECIHEPRRARATPIFQPPQQRPHLHRKIGTCREVHVEFWRKPAGLLQSTKRLSRRSAGFRNDRPVFRGPCAFPAEGHSVRLGMPLGEENCCLDRLTDLISRVGVGLADRAQPGLTEPAQRPELDLSQ